MNIKLQLTTEQQKELSELAAKFNQELEDRSTPPFPKATTLQALKEQLYAALLEQEGFEEIWEKARTEADLLCLSHEKNGNQKPTVADRDGRTSPFGNRQIFQKRLDCSPTFCRISIKSIGDGGFS